MDVDESKIGEWPNVALNPGTHTHAATGEHVEQPENTRIGRSRGACRPVSTPSDSEPADVENGAQNGLECDTREKLEADVRNHFWHNDWCRTEMVIDWLNRQEAITEREHPGLTVSDDESLINWRGRNYLPQSRALNAERERDEFSLKLKHEMELNRDNRNAHDLERIDSLTAERDDLLRTTKELEERNGGLLEGRAHWIDQAVSIYRHFYPHNAYAVPDDVSSMVLAKIAELEAECDELKRCWLEETDSYNAARVGWNAELETFTVHVHECSECGKECEQVNGTYERCPHCGAVNELDEDYRETIPRNELELIRMAEKYKLADGVDSRNSIEEDALELAREIWWKGHESKRAVESSDSIAWEVRNINHLLNRQAAITEREVLCQPDERDEQIAELTAERDMWRDAAGDVHDMWERADTELRAMTAERDHLREVVKAQADSFAKLERELHEAMKKEAVDEVGR